MISTPNEKTLTKAETPSSMDQSKARIRRRHKANSTFTEEHTAGSISDKKFLNFVSLAGCLICNLNVHNLILMAHMYHKSDSDSFCSPFVAMITVVLLSLSFIFTETLTFGYELPHWRKIFPVSLTV